MAKGYKQKGIKHKLTQNYESTWLKDTLANLTLCYRVLLRVRMLYYLRQEVIGDQAERILDGADSRLVRTSLF